MPKSNPEPTIKRRVIVSTLAQVGSQIMMALIGIAILKVMTSHLGIKDYGVYATILAFVSTFSLLTDLGLNAITSREIAKNPEQADDIISYNMGLRIFMCAVMIPAIFGLSFIVYRHSPPVLHIGILLVSLYLFFDAARSVMMAYFASKIRSEVTAMVNVLQQVILFGFVILAVLMGWRIYGFIAAFLISNFVATVITVYLSRKEVRVRPRMNIVAWRRIIALSASLGIIQLVDMIYLKADSILLSTLKGTTEVGIYSIAYSLIFAFMTLPGFIMTALLPSIATSSKKQAEMIMQKALQYMMIFACLLAAGAFIVRHELILTITSSQFASAATPFAILALATAFSYINTVFGFISVSLNKHHKLTYVSIATLILNIGLNFVFIPLYSVNGAALATAISEVVTISVTYIIFTRETGFAIRHPAHFWKPLVSAALLLPVLFLLHFLWSTSSHLLNLVTASTIIAVSYTAALLILKGLPSEVVDHAKPYLKKLKNTLDWR